MRQLRWILLALCLFNAGCEGPEVLTPKQFVAAFIAALKTARPSSTADITNEYQVKVTTGGTSLTVNLQNAYLSYSRDPSSKDRVIQQFVGNVLAFPGSDAQVLDRTKIIPLIKDRRWVKETRDALVAQKKDAPERVYEDFCADLIVVYVEEMKGRFRFFGVDDLTEAKIDRKDLRQLACANLQQRLPQLGLGGANGVYVMSSGNDLDASLLLMDQLWQHPRMELKGDPVVMVPSRSLLLVTGSNDIEGIKAVREAAEKDYNKGAYQISLTMLVYREGHFIEFTPSTGAQTPPRESQPSP